MGKLDGRVAIVVGSTSGIGKAIGELFAEEGAQVIITGRREEVGNEVVKAIEDKGNKAAFYRVDVSDEEASRKLIQDVYNDFGRIDILINNAGIAKEVKMEDMDSDFWDAIYDTNIRSHYILTQEALPYLEESGNGSIVFTASMAALKAFDGQYAYGSSKAAIIQFMKMVAAVYAERGVRANSIAPGVIATDILKNAGEGYIDAIAETIPMKRLGEPIEIAKLALFLASDDSSYVTGQNIACDGAASIV